MIIELSRPLHYKDSELSVISLDLETMTGTDLLAVEDELRMSGINSPAWEYSRTFLITIAARSAHIPVEVLKGMNIRDFTKVVNEVLSFLAGQVSEVSTAANSDE